MENNAGLNDTVKYFWSPSVRWEKKDNEVRIEIFSYKGYIVDVFPQFYYLTQKGITLDELKNALKEFDERRILNFALDLNKKRVLVNSILTPAEIFFPQNYLFENKYSEKIKYDADELNSFKKKQLNRDMFESECKNLKLASNIEYPEYISERKTYRSFNKSDKIDFGVFSKLISVFKQLKENGVTKYNYASAGGLYPIDIYIYVKEDRVSNVDSGLYYYNPVDNVLKLFNSSCQITKDAHFFTNQSIFENSAFTIFLVYNADVTMPKYGGMGYYYSLIDAGIMVGLITTVAETCGIGLCSIGDMDFRKIEKHFSLNRNQIFLHAIEVGLKI